MSSVSSTASTSTRGTMTSRAIVSPRSNTSWIICFSSSERSSCSETMYLSSSSETLSSACLMRRSLERPSALALVSHTSGFMIVWKALITGATDFALPSGSDSAMRLGTSSPITMLK